MIQVSLNNGPVQEVGSVRVFVGVETTGDNGELHLNITDEGVIRDVIVNGQVVATDSQTHQEAVDVLELGVGPESAMATDPKPVNNIRNFYKCPNCGERWEDLWSCACDDQCPKCLTKNISPTHSEDA